jgi:3',5'-cyclic AMP phosphodiesterase CpdA
VRIVCISDTHVPVKLPPIPDGDILIHAGDLTCDGTYRQVATAGAQLAELPHRHKIVIAGNHDKLFQQDIGLARGALGDGHRGITYLQDELGRSKGSSSTVPWTPRFYGGRFSLSYGVRKRNGPSFGDSGPAAWGGDRHWRTAAAHWARLPDKIDVLVTHGPPRGILDQTPNGNHMGDADLLEAVKRIRPRLHVFGHIHSHPGRIEGEGTIFVNAVTCDENYNATRPPIVVDL